MKGKKVRRMESMRRWLDRLELETPVDPHPHPHPRSDENDLDIDLDLDLSIPPPPPSPRPAQLPFSPPSPPTPRLAPISPVPSSPTTPARIDTMNHNNFGNNYDANNNINRPPPAHPNQQAPQMNGVGSNPNWPNVGAQADMNVLWEYIQNLSQMHEGIRSQTQQVLNGVQQIQARGIEGTAQVSGGQVNGVNSSASPNTQALEISRLQNELSSANTRIEDLNTHISLLSTLNADYESCITTTLDRLRPFTQSHTTAMHLQKAHYLRLIEDERQQNHELRLEQSRWQESLGRLNENLREAFKAQSESERPYQRKISALKQENRSLRRMCGVPPLEESDESEGEEEEELDAGEAGLGEGRSAQGSPQEEDSNAGVRNKGRIRIETNEV